MRDKVVYSLITLRRRCGSKLRRRFGRRSVFREAMQPFAKLRLTLPLTRARLLHLRNRCGATRLSPANLLASMLDADFAECIRLKLRPILPLSEDADIASTNTDRRTKATPEVVQVVLHLLD